MSGNRELTMFVRSALERGQSRAAIEQALTQAGWAPRQINATLAEFAEVDFPVPVPRPSAYLSAREAFLYLVVFTALGIASYQLGALLFNIINLLVPDPAVPGRETAIYRGIRWAIASLVVAFPLYLSLTVMLERAVIREPRKRASKVRRWLTYLALFVAAVVIIGDLVTLVYKFLGGELSLRIGLKVLTVGVIASAIFTFYLRTVRRDEQED